MNSGIRSEENKRCGEKSDFLCASFLYTDGSVSVQGEIMRFETCCPLYTDAKIKKWFIKVVVESKNG